MVLSPEVAKNLEHLNYWDRPTESWGSLLDWDVYFVEEVSGASRRECHSILSTELEILIEHFPKKIAVNGRGPNQ
ncbi:hypothetical protein BC936DRAFT_136578 [Jimgerdemannia flammicorona]|uniref:Uncharacterized protein n=1 Tax=Jimgerdemannia flammicorona TaxID=994334 RepID=A0A433CZ80_9FUNG|nr:hypothetical protein BC936DRAFT_136578 [Jimgerdemannia flammicorona]